MRRFKYVAWMVSFASVAGGGASAAGPAANPMVRFITNQGDIEIELYAAQAPETVRNFLAYVDEGFYNGTIFHRVIPGFVIQGGGFEPGMRQKKTHAPIHNEADNGLKNLTGTLSMARTPNPDSATSQFFINLRDNASLDHRDKSTAGYGYAVFGRVSKGMDVVEKIAKVRTGSKSGHGDVPIDDVVTTRAERVK